MIKSITDIEQSKRLAEILPIESADYSYMGVGVSIHQTLCSYAQMLEQGYEKDEILPCWSLAALLGVIPNMARICKDGLYFIEWENMQDYLVTTQEYDNPVDACVELIEKLHKEGLL